MDQPVFSIRKLSCSYSKKEEDKVLYIDKLDIQAGELIFLLGASGSGKSTLLETLGLMNNTMASGDIDFYAGEKSYSYEKLWSSSNADISFIRKQHFSFIFQNTNLMENFTAYENICLPRMIQQDVRQEEVMKDASDMMKRVGLPESQVSSSTLAVNLSGGQRQRLSFVRALSSNCSVLFCDEPTGNLDESNANELMGLIKEIIVGKKITAIVVSHDIDLALNHASRIICVTKNQNDKFGTVQDSNIFTRDQWENLDHEGRFQFRKKLKGFYISNADKNVTVEQAEQKKKGSFNFKFHNLFLRKEGLTLAGKNYGNLLILIFLFFFTFLSIGFANGSLEYLHTKLNNAFVNWLNIAIPVGKQSQVESIKKDLAQPEIRAKFHFSHVSSYSEMTMRFLHMTKRRFIPVQTRSVEMKGGADPLIADITDESHIIAGNPGYIGEQDFSAIVTGRFLSDLGYAPDAAFVYMEMPHFTDTGTAAHLIIDTVPIGIRSVVKEIPGKMQCAYTSYFWDAYLQNQENTFDTRTHKRIYLFCPGSKALCGDFRNLVVDRIAKWHDDAPQASPVDTCTVTYVKGYKIKIDLIPVPSYDSLEAFYRFLVSDPKISDFIRKNKVARFYDYYDFTPRFGTEKSPDKLSINFTDLEKVRDFSTYVREQYNSADEMNSGTILEADLAAIKDKENFEYLSTITTGTASIIIILSITAVCLFIFNMLKMHLAKVKMNIGTFTATGLSNLSAQMIYFEIILLFISGSLLLSLAVAGISGYYIDKLIASRFVVETGISYFKINGVLTYLTIALILVISLTVSLVTIRRMLSKSPGDLIYNR